MEPKGPVIIYGWGPGGKSGGGGYEKFLMDREEKNWESQNEHWNISS